MKNDILDQKDQKKADDGSATNVLDFITPTEIVDLPSKGLGYPKNHPLCGKDSVEIKYMTAKEEDILSSASLLKKGIALERFLKAILKDQSIDPETMLSGDRNAVIIAARSSGYGFDYDTKVNCPSCGEANKMSFDLLNPKIKEMSEEAPIDEAGVLTVMTPMTKIEVKMRLMNGKDELYLSKQMKMKKNKNLPDSQITDQFRRIITSVAGHEEGNVINMYIDKMPTKDSRYLRKIYKEASPNVEIKQDFTCRSCNFTQELEVPFGADFFWPDS